MKTRIRIWSAVLCAVLVLSLSFNSLPVSATEYETDVSLPKLLDITLTAQGVVASPAVLDSVSDKLVGLVQDGVDSVYNAMVNAGETSWDNVSNYIGECIEDYTLQKPTEAFIKSILNNGFLLPVVTAVDVATSLSPNEHGGAGRERGKTYTLNEEFIDSINDVFQVWWSENADYYIWRVPAFSEINPDYFSATNYTIADNFFEAIAENNKLYVIGTQNKTTVTGQTSMSLTISEEASKDWYYYIDSDITQETAKITPYYDGIAQKFTTYGYIDSNGSFKTELNNFSENGMISGLEKDVNGYNSYNLFYSYTSGTIGYYGSCWIFRGAVGRNAFNIRLFKDTETANNFSVGDQTVYFSPDYNPESTHTVTYTGDYYIDNSSTYNYNTVQETIDNSNTIDNSIVNEIVDNSITNITNNYSYVTPEDTPTPTPSGDSGDSSGGDGSGGDSDSSNPFDGVFEKLMDALGNVVGLLDDIVALVLSFVGDALNAIVGMFTSVINLLTAFKDELSGLSGALGEFFPYLPEEFWTIIMASISVICGLAIIRYFMNK